MQTMTLPFNYSYLSLKRLTSNELSCCATMTNHLHRGHSIYHPKAVIGFEQRSVANYGVYLRVPIKITRRARRIILFALALAVNVVVTRAVTKMKGVVGLHWQQLENGNGRISQQPTNKENVWGAIVCILDEVWASSHWQFIVLSHQHDFFWCMHLWDKQLTLGYKYCQKFCQAMAICG